MILNPDKQILTYDNSVLQAQAQNATNANNTGASTDVDNVPKPTVPAQTTTQTQAANQAAQAPTTNSAGIATNTTSNAAKASMYLQNALNGGNGYTSPYQQQVSDLYNQIMNRKQFNFDINGDALYNQYREQYTNAGRRAMQDTIGTASGMTGGYGNSYAVSAGEQAYQDWLTQLNDKSMDIYDRALDRYNAEGDRLGNMFNMANSMEARDYERYQAEKQQAYSTAMAMLQAGYMPSSEILELSGISADDAYALWYAGGAHVTKLGKATTGTYHSSSGKKKKTTKKTTKKKTTTNKTTATETKTGTFARDLFNSVASKTKNVIDSKIKKQ